MMKTAHTSKKTTKRMISTAFLLAQLALVQAQITLPSIFGDHMVLQQKSEAPIWGNGNASEQIKLVGSWNPRDTVKTTVNSQGRWKTNLNTTAAGGPYRLKIIGSSTIEIQDVMLGEVWLCSGQSNMEWSANSGIVAKDIEISKANYPDIRFFKVEKRGSAYPQDDCEGEWVVCTPETMQSRSAVAYFFARKLQQDLDVPIGMMIAAWGGTTAEVWTPQAEIEHNETLKTNILDRNHPWWPNETGSLYNQMIHPILPYRIAGTLWYQGESNHERYNSYNLLMKTMVTAWRKKNGTDFPFYFVQIAPFQYNSTANTPALLREQQEKTALELPKSGMVVVSDLVDNIADIHPIDKQNVGLRLANLALAETYQQAVKGHQSPTFDKMTRKNKQIILSFHHAQKGIKMKGNKIVGLEVSDDKGQVIPTQIKIRGANLIISAKKLPETVNVRYCFDDSSIGNLFSVEGNLPIAPFRSDKK